MLSRWIVVGTRRYVAGLTLAALLGCGSSHEAEPGPTAAASIHIPMEPQSRVEAPLTVFGPTSGEAPTYTHEHSMTFARGAGYPDAVETVFTDFAIGRCGHEGTITVTSVTADGAGIEARPTSDRGYEVAVVPGSPDGTVIVRGTFLADEPVPGPGCAVIWETEDDGELVWELRLDVRSRAIHGVSVDCHPAEGLAYFAGTRIGRARYRPVDADGGSFLPANATRERPVDITLAARAGELEIGPEGDLASVRLPSAATIVDIAAPAGSSVPLRVLDPSIVTGVAQHFSLEGIYNMHLSLTDGDVIDGAMLEGMGKRLVAGYGELEISDGESMCSGLPIEAFQLRSHTPEVCPVLVVGDEDPPVRGLGAPFGAATATRDGECRLEWSAPTLNGGRGLAGTLDVTIVNADALPSAP